ncbi:MAG: alpha-N-arabinofuranosidase [Planctomycetes bacterium]|nr:alpha-N-arabinofuranosidase [Planctomycetota bacterium]
MAIHELFIHPSFVIDEVDPRIFGGFLEHVGRAVYEGIYDPQSAHADTHGQRTDVCEALRVLDMSCIRYPGGNFASAYRWQDGVGIERPVKRSPAWNGIEDNTYGTDEFMQTCKTMEWAPVLCVNLGTGTAEEAGDWVEYCNGAAGTLFADQRVANGRKDPYKVSLWCLGNEMDGPWQIGHVPAEAYAQRAQQAGRIMKGIDPAIELIACGSCGIELESYLTWDQTVLEYLGEQADYLSIHRYVGKKPEDGELLSTADYLAVSNSIDQQIEAVYAVCEMVAHKQKRAQAVKISFDEWNVWYRTAGAEDWDAKGQRIFHLLEEEYSLEDAMAVAGFLNSFIRHADMVKIANIAQIVNVIAPVMTKGDDMLLQSIYYVFRMFSTRRSGVSLRCSYQGATYDSIYGPAALIDHSVILKDKTLQVFLSNRCANSETLRLSCAQMQLGELLSAEELVADNIEMQNTFEHPRAVCSKTFDRVKIHDDYVDIQLSAYSVCALSFAVA